MNSTSVWVLTCYRLLICFPWLSVCTVLYICMLCGPVIPMVYFLCFLETCTAFSGPPPHLLFLVCLWGYPRNLFKLIANLDLFRAAFYGWMPFLTPPLPSFPFLGPACEITSTERMARLSSATYALFIFRPHRLCYVLCDLLLLTE